MIIICVTGIFITDIDDHHMCHRHLKHGPQKTTQIDTIACSTAA
jgi:hypothetical protein